MNASFLSERRRITYCGLIIALLAAPIFAAVYRKMTGENHSNLQLVAREIGFLLLVGLILWLIRAKEKLPLSSIGLHADKPLRSILRGFVLTVITLILTVGLYLLLQAFGLHLGGDGIKAFQPSVWVTTLIALRAGKESEASSLY